MDAEGRGLGNRHDEPVDGADDAPITTAPKGSVAPDGAATAPAADHRRELDPTLLLAPLLAVVSLLAMSLPGWVPIASPLCVLAWIGLGAVWLVRIVAWVRHRRGGEPDGRPLWLFLVWPVFFVIVVASAAAALPIRARFNLSHDDLTAAGDAVLEARAATDIDRIGSIPVESLETNGVQVWFVTSGFGTANRWGFLYSPTRAPMVAARGSIEQLDDHWWIFHEGAGAYPPF